MTKIKTPTRTVSLTLTDPKTGVDWSGDYVGNVADMAKDEDGVYRADDETATWWERQIAAQQKADDLVATLTAAQRDAYAELLNEEGAAEFNDAPAQQIRLAKQVQETAAE